MDQKTIQKREEELLDALKLTSKLSVEDAVNILGVSESTARRLFARLEDKELVIRVYGGISIVRHEDDNYAYERLEIRNVEQKARIGAAAAGMISEGDIIFLDTGTTLPHMCLALSKRIEAGELSGLRIFTSSLVNLNILQKVAPVILIGGEYRPNRRDFHGYLAEEAIKRLHFGKCFLGADGVDTVAGFTTTDFTTSRMNQLALEHSSKVYILCDSSKFGRVSAVTYADISDVGYLVTDSLPSGAADKFAARGMKVVIAD